MTDTPNPDILAGLESTAKLARLARIQMVGAGQAESMFRLDSARAAVIGSLLDLFVELVRVDIAAYEAAKNRKAEVVPLVARKLILLRSAEQCLKEAKLWRE